MNYYAGQAVPITSQLLAFYSSVKMPWCLGMKCNFFHTNECKRLFH